MSFLKRIAITALLLCVFGMVMVAQDDPTPLPNTFTTDDESFSISYPEGWVAQLIGGSVFLLSNEALLQDLSSLPEGEIALNFITGAALGNLGLDAETEVTDALQTFAGQVLQGQGEVEAYEGLPFPAAFAPVIGEGIANNATVFALKLDAGFVFVLAIYGGELADFDANLNAVLSSLVYSPDAESATITLSEEGIYTSESGKTRVMIPNGWRVNETDGNIIIASTREALNATDQAMQNEGDIQVIISPPELLPEVGLDAAAEPEGVIETFLRILNSEAVPELYEGIDVPAYRVFLEGIIPAGDGYLITLSKDGGTFFVSVAFVGEFEGYEPVISEILNSLAYDPDAEPRIMPEAEATEPAAESEITPEATAETGSN